MLSYCSLYTSVVFSSNDCTALLLIYRLITSLQGTILLDMQKGILFLLLFLLENVIRLVLNTHGFYWIKESGTAMG